MKTPCKDCPERQLHCHSSCPKYAEYKQELADIEARKQAYKSEMNFLTAEKSAVRAMWRKKKMNIVEERYNGTNRSNNKSHS